MEKDKMVKRRQKYFGQPGVGMGGDERNWVTQVGGVVRKVCAREAAGEMSRGRGT